MPSYDIHFKASARKELAALSDSIALRVLEKIEARLSNQDRMAAESCAAQRIFGGYEWVTTASFTASMIALRKSPSFEFVIGAKSMTNLDRNGPAKSWTWSGGPVQARAFDLDGRQTSYPYTGAGTVNGLRPPRLTYDLGNRIKNLSGTLTKAYGHDGPRPPGKLDRLATYSNEVYAYGATGNRTSMMFCQCAAREIRERNGFGMARLSGCSAGCTRHTFFWRRATIRTAPAAWQGIA